MPPEQDDIWRSVIEAGSEVENKDLVMRAIRVGLKVISGGILDDLVFGAIDDARARRLDEWAEAVKRDIEDLKRQGRTVGEAAEEIVKLLEAVVPAVYRETSDEKRERFRDLIVNGFTTPAGDPAWSEAELAKRLLLAIDPPGLTIIAALGRSPERSNSLFSKPSPHLQPGDFGPGDALGKTAALPYTWVVLEEWVRRLREMRLLGIGGHGASSDSPGGQNFTGLTLTELGRALVHWTVRTGVRQ